MGILRFTLEIEDVDDEDFNISDEEAKRLLADMEEILAKADYSIYDTDFERE